MQNFKKMNENELMQKLALSKAIMEKSNLVKNTGNRDYGFVNEDRDFDIPQAKYNIPSEYMTQQPTNESYIPNSNPIKAVGTPTVEAIKNSKLPDEIKRLMIEHPIVQPNTATNPVLSDELVERATRLMGNTNESKIPEKSKQVRQGINQNISEGIDYTKIQKMIESAVNKALRENGMIAESTEKSNESFQFKVGKHIFEGKVTKIKKIP